MGTRWMGALAAATLVAASLTASSVATASPVPAAGPPTTGGALCGPVTPTNQPQAADRLRIGIDPGLAGNTLPSARPPEPVDPGKELRALDGLHVRGHVLVVRLNRLFWSGGEPLLQSFAKQARQLRRDGFDVEVQVRYHPTPAEDGNIAAWTRYVRHVVDVLGSNPRVVSLTITNEVNVTFSPNTSDGSYRNAKAALVRGIEAAHDQLARHGWAGRVQVGFTFAYRFNPQTDAALFDYLRSDGGPRFAAALGFVGLDDYPGTVYPPAVPPGETAGDELASAIATTRTCYMHKAGLSQRVPLWVTENGYPSSAPQHTEANQAAQLTGMVDATRRVGGTYHVTDYRWFNLRDNDSHGDGEFDQDGLLRDDYSHKPSYDALQDFIARHATREQSSRR